MKKILFIIFASTILFAGCSKKQNEQKNEKSEVVISALTDGSAVISGGTEKSTAKVIASTSWTAAFADLAGVDDVEIIAPASLRHPPEYEITVSDIEKISNCDVFIYAGFERMMKTLGDSVGDVNMMKVSCNNAISNVSAQVAKIANEMGTSDISEERLMVYINTINEGKMQLESKGLAGAKVFCNANQIYLAKDLGLDIAATFGPGEVTSEQIKQAKDEGFAFIIDNVHNPVAAPLAEVSNAKYVIWRNFPERVERDALTHVVAENIKQLF